MKDAAFLPLDAPAASMGRLLGGEAKRMAKVRDSVVDVLGEPTASAAAYAMAVLETNASMGRIVAAPPPDRPASSPACCWRCRRRRGIPTSSSSARLPAPPPWATRSPGNATVSGAEGGCQAEIGSAAAMAAAACVELEGGTPEQCLNAAGNALTNMMGLVCDPVAGLVEVPCQKRNASGAATALVSAQTSLAGIGNLVGFDQTVEASTVVGRSLPLRAARIGPRRPGGNPRRLRLVRIAHAREIGRRVAGFPHPCAKPARTRGRCEPSRLATRARIRPVQQSEAPPQTTEVCGALPKCRPQRDGIAPPLEP